MTGKIWIFDLDDTLIPNHHDYSHVQLDYLRWMLKKINNSTDERSEAQINFAEWVIQNVGYKGPDVHAILNKQVELEQRLTPDYEDLKQAFISSLHTTYYEVCKKMGKVPTQEELEIAASFGEITNFEFRNIDAHHILNRQVEIDKNGAEAKGFGKERFPTSLRLTYEDILHTCGLQTIDSEAQEVYDIGTTVFDKKRYEQNGLLPGAEKTLDFLLGKGDELVLITKGDLEVQQDKVEANRLYGWFGDEVYVVNKKSEWTLQRLARGNLGGDSAQMYHVGNSIRSDVYPALNFGMNSVYLPCETWAFERDHNGVPKDSRLIKLGNIDDIIKNYDSF